ncbi:MAG TPA: hypothetical protein VFX97_14980 [Pyrinomonadaceae bacterium]|nr:hypothetical protein [Pyrinomonadaceae bacterium]
MQHTPRKDVALCAVVLFTTLLLTPAAAAQPGIEHLDSREAFNAASSGLSTIDFGSVAPAKGFGKYRPEEGLTTGGVTFRARGGARFGPGLIYVISTHYGSMNPMHNTGLLPQLAWAAPNQPGNAYLDVTLPSGTTAVGGDLWTQQPYVSTIEVTATTSDGQTQTVVVNTRNRPAASFVGFISDKSIVSISFRPPKGVSGLLLDNLTYGRKAEGRSVRASTPAAAQTTTSSPIGAQPPAAQTSPPAEPVTLSAANESPVSPSATPTPTGRPREQTASNNATARGTIAYIRGGTEIRLIESDGTNDRRLWTHEFAKEGSAIHGLAWRPDGKELAFSSSHLNVASLYHADIYGVGPDGKGFRKITNAPDHSELSRYPKGAVSVTVRNEQPLFKQSRATTGVFFVYVVGADEPQPVTIPPGSSKTLLFKNVADYGDHAQAVVAMYGQYRWFIPGVDVKAGRTIKSPDFGISGDGYELYGAFRPTWRSDGSRLSFRNGLCLVNTVPAKPNPGEFVYQPLFSGKHPDGACSWDWGPTPALADQIIYSANSDGEGSSIHRVKEGGAHPGNKVHPFSELDLQLVTDLRWLPDGSGFLYSFPDLAYEFGNIFRYDLGTKRATQLTKFEGDYARAFDISPDGAWVVFERAKKWDDDKDVDLWIMRTDGSEPRLLVRGGLAPSWR